MEFEEYLKINRQRAGMTQKSLAEKVNISTSYLNLIEGGKKRPNPSIITRLAKALDGNPDEWLDLAGYRVPEIHGGRGKPSEKPFVKVLGELGEGDSPFLGQSGPTLELGSQGVRVRDTSLQTFGYQPGDILIIGQRPPVTGELVILRTTPSQLSMQVFSSGTRKEQVLGPVEGLVRSYEAREARPTVISNSGPTTAPQSEAEMQETLEDIKSLLAKIAGEDEAGNSD